MNLLNILIIRGLIPDPDAKKPEDWDEDQPRQILDESATMPDGWLVDEESMVINRFVNFCIEDPINLLFLKLNNLNRTQPQQIPDPTAEKPDDWEDDVDGDWEPALIDNPVCESAPGCGPWNKPMIDNPL